MVCINLLDLVIVVDSSWSILDTQPPEGVDSNWTLMLQFLAGIIEALEIGPTSVQVGMVVFADNARIEFYLNSFTNKADLINQILNTEFIGGATNTAEGLNYAHYQLFTSQNGARDLVPRVIMLLTDGESNVNQPNTILEAEAAQGDNINMLVIGVTNAVNEDELRGISSAPRLINQNYWLSPDFMALESIAASISRFICEVIPLGLYCTLCACYQRLPCVWR